MSEFYFNETFVVSKEIQKSFDLNGFVIVRNLLSKAEVAKIIKFYENSEDIEKYAYGRDDGLHKKTKVCLWNYAGDDIGDMVSRSDKVVTTFENLLGCDELYHYHSKLMMKEARTGGQHVWHQDYGYWYESGCLYPNMGSVFIALDPCVKENGCLQVLAGSHKMGRFDHILISNGGVAQRGADLNRVNMAKEQLELVHVELQPGDVVFFHCNLLHTSAQNLSDMRRWSMICAYNSRDNDPVFSHHHPNYHPLTKVDNGAIIRCTNTKSKIDKEYLNPLNDFSVNDKNKEMIVH